MIEKKDFLKHVTVLCDTGEQKNAHIKKQLDGMKVRYADVNLDFGDYSFEIGGKNFAALCVIERKANVDELYGNLMQDRERLERELQLASAVCNDFTVLIEHCADAEALKAYTVSDYELELFGRKRKDIGTLVYQTIQSWQCGNRYHFHTIYVSGNAETAVKMVEKFYYYYRNYKRLSANRKLSKRPIKSSKGKKTINEPVM